MNISLPEELERLVKERVESGLYGSASEVVREALRNMFFKNDQELTSYEAEQIRKIVLPRLKAIDDGTAKLIPFEQAMKEIDQDIFGE